MKGFQFIFKRLLSVMEITYIRRGGVMDKKRGEFIKINPVVFIA